MKRGIHSRRALRGDFANGVKVDVEHRLLLDLLEIQTEILLLHLDLFVGHGVAPLEQFAGRAVVLRGTCFAHPDFLPHNFPGISFLVNVLRKNDCKIIITEGFRGSTL